MIRAIFYDLDNTIYPVKEFGDKMFMDLFLLIENTGGYEGDISEIKDKLMRIPFQKAGQIYKFSEDLMNKGNALLKELEYEGPIKTFPGYTLSNNIPAERYLITAGFKKLQMSKIMGLGIKNDFKEIYIVDASETNDTKKDVMARIIKTNVLKPSEVLVLGDDAESEIKAGNELGFHTILFDGYKELDKRTGEYLIAQSYEDVVRIMDQIDNGSN